MDLSFLLKCRLKVPKPSSNSHVFGTPCRNIDKCFKKYEFLNLCSKYTWFLADHTHTLALCWPKIDLYLPRKVQTYNKKVRFLHFLAVETFYAVPNKEYGLKTYKKHYFYSLINLTYSKNEFNIKAHFKYR